MCGKGGGGGTTTQVTNNRPPEEVIQNYNYVMGLAKDVQKTPFTPYTGEFVAPLSETQKAGIQNVNQAQGVAMPAYAQGAKYTMEGAQGVTPQFSQAGLQPYMSPYLNSVVGATMANINEQNAQQRAALQGNALSRGAYGGDRYGIGAANLARQQGLSTGQTISNLLQAGYGQALGQYNQNISQQQADQTRRLAAGQQLASLGEGAQKSLLSGAQAQLAAGAQEQATRQALDQAVYNQFLSQQAYPFQNLSWLGSLATGLGANMGGTSTSQTTAPSSSGGANIFGALTAIASLPWSDERLKENKEVVGKTFDGQPIYKFNYKGNNTTQMGLMAQNVEKSHPDAVYNLGGLKKVDYDAALDDAADRGHYYSGGLAHPAHREHYAIGGGGSFGSMPYADLMKIPSIVPSEKIQGGRPTLSQPNTPAPNLAPKSAVADIAKGLQAMPDAAKKRMMKNLGDVTGLSEGTVDVSKLKAGQGAAGLPSNMDQFTSGSYNYAQPSSGGLGSWIGSLFGFADGGLVPAEAFADGGMIGRGTSMNARGLLPAGMADGGTPPEEDPMDRYARAISGIESGGRYDIVGPETRGDRPYGRYQVMGRNVGPWTEAAIGQRMTPEEFLANKDAQNAVFKHRFGQYLAQTGTPEDAASMWFSGRPMSQAGNSRDVLGTSVPAYVQKFRAGLGMADLPSGNAAEAQFRIPRGSDGEEKGLMGRLTDTEGAPRSLLERITGMNLSDEARSGLLAAGLGMMASKSPSFLGALGEGGLGGLQTYYNALANKQNLEKQQSELGLKERETSVHEKRLGIEEKSKNLEVLKFWQSKFQLIPTDKPGVYKYRDSVTGKELSPDEYNSQMSALMKQLGLDMGDTGLGAAPAPAAPKPSTGVVSPTPAQPTAPATTEAAPQAAPAGTTTEQPPKTEEKKQQAATPVVPPSAFNNVSEEYNPYTLQQQAAREDIVQRNAESIGNTAMATNAAARAKELRERAAKILSGDQQVIFRDGTTGFIPELLDAKNKKSVDEEFSKKQADSRSKFSESATKYLEDYDSQRALVNNLVNIYSKMDMNRLSEVKADLAGLMRDLPWIGSAVKATTGLDWSGLQTANDAAMKSAVEAAFNAIRENQAQKAPATALKEAMMTVANPTMAPGAKYSLLTKELAKDDYKRKMYEDWIEAGQPDHAKFMVQWKRNNKLEDFEKRSVLDTPYFAGMTDAEKKMMKYSREDLARQELERRRAQGVQ